VVALTQEAASILARFDRKGIGFRKKGGRDLVTAADLASEEFLLQRIRERFPDHRIIAEETSSEHGTDLRQPTWILDPLDGTTNFVHGLPHCAVSVAFYCDGAPTLACVANPRIPECFSAERGRGAFLNGERIQVAETEHLSEALLATGFHYRREEMPDSNLAHVSDFLFRVRCLRRLGAASLDLCYVACGRLDGYWELWLSPWDVAAGGLIAEEAGALVTDFSANDRWLFGGEVVASNPKLHREILHVLRDADPSALPGPQFQP
jgi:myo-inositol-1(or 4)-monophosphatase